MRQRRRRAVWVLWSASGTFSVLLLYFALSILFSVDVVTREDLGLPEGLPMSSKFDVADVSPGVVVHTTYAELPSSGNVGANGLIVASRKSAVLIDTGWTETDAAWIVHRAKQEFGPVQAVIVTHAHDDRMGGLAQIHRLGVPSYASEATARIALDRGLEQPTHTFKDGMSLEQFGIDGEVFYPGHGHSADNVVVWLAKPKVLFGGCMIRDKDATTLGNTADADLDAWPTSVQTLIDRYPNAQWVVPGHGDPQPSAILLTHTLQLLQAR